MVGTLGYAAPERLAGGDVTPRSDVWALGAVLYEMLTGVPAVTASDPVGALAASQAAPATLEGVPPYLASVIDRAMATDPADRYPDAVALRDALAADGAPVDPNAMTAVVPIVAPVATVAAIAPRASAIAGTPPVEPVRASTPVVGHPGPRPNMPLRLGALTAALVLAAVALFAMASSSLLAGGGDGDRSGAGTLPQASAATPVASAAPLKTARPTPSAQSTPTAKPKPEPGKGKGKGKPPKHH
jgi:serine/threonine-protein kinase